jgi:hypothetical protein
MWRHKTTRDAGSQNYSSVLTKMNNGLIISVHPVQLINISKWSLNCGSLAHTENTESVMRVRRK